MAEPIIQRSFAAGEFAPALHARADLARYHQGARKLLNFFVRKEGGVSNRAGFRYVATAKTGDSSGPNENGLIRLYRWAFTAADQSILIEAGDEYFRFYRDGAPIVVDTAPAYSGSDDYLQGDLVSNAGLFYYAVADSTGEMLTDEDFWYPLTDGIYEIPTPYGSGAFDSPGPLRFNQSGVVITVTHPGFHPMELQNLDPLETAGPRWVLVDVTTDPSISAPAGGSATPGAVGTRTFAYQVTAVKADDYEESLPSAVFSATLSAVGTEDAPIELAWTAVTVPFAAAEYNVYCDPYGNGTFGFIGVATGQVTFNDTGITPDFSQTPPITRDPFATTQDSPEMSAFYQQRRVFAYTDNKPSTATASRTGFRSNFSISSPLQDDDAIEFTMAGNDMNVIRHLISLKRLVILTETGEWILKGDQDGVLRPDAINLDQEGYTGSSRAFPAVAGQSIVFVHARGRIVMELKFSSDVLGFETRDLTTFATHLFETDTIARLEYQKDPHSIVWAVRADGTLLGLTYVPDQDVWAWHQHSTDGLIEDICVVPEQDQDALYLVVNRTIDGETQRYIERMESRVVTEDGFDLEAFFVDAGATYDGAAATTLTGLEHLAGERVAVLGDGEVLSNGVDAVTLTVSDSGTLTLPSSVEIAHVGLPIPFADLETLSLDVEGSSMRDKKKTVKSVTAIVDRSRQGFYAGPNESDLTQQDLEPTESATDLKDGISQVTIVSSWGDDGRVLIRHKDPTPLTILGLMPLVEVGG